MSESELHQSLLRKVDRVVDEAGDLRQELQFARATDALTRRRTKLADLRTRLTRIRARGYCYKAGLADHLERAERAAPQAVEDLLEESSRLGNRLRPQVEDLARRAKPLLDESDLGDKRAVVDALEDEQRDLEREIRDAAKRLEAISEPVVQAVDVAEKGIKEAEAVLEAFEEGGFDLEPAEEPIAVVEASWEDAPGGAQAGKLMFTNARVRFLQDEIKKSGGFLGFGADKTHVKELQIDEPVGYLAASDDTTRGWVFKDQVLAFKWSSEASVRKKTTTFEVSGGSAKTWDTLVESIRDGSIATDRVEPEGYEEVILQFPSECTACGGQLPAAVKGQRTLECPFCATVNQPVD